MALGFCFLPLLGFAEDQTPDTTSMSILKTIPTVKLEVNIKIDPLTEEQMRAGLDLDSIKELIIQKLRASGISNNETLQQPTLVLRVRSIEVGTDIATFFQLCLLEPSMLLRTRSVFNAITWSQASLLSCRPEDLKKEALETISVMTQSFTEEFITAYQPIAK